MARRLARRRRNPKPKAVPKDVLAQVPRGQRRDLQSAIRALGGYDTEIACGRRDRYPVKGWENTRALIVDIENQHGIDLSAMDPACLRDTFCETLGLKLPPKRGGTKRGQRYCPDTRARGGWKKALSLALGQRPRRFATLRERDEYRAFQRALAECEDIAIYPAGEQDVLQWLDVVEACEAEHPGRIDELIELARRGRLRVVAIPDDGDPPF